jgi:cytochrome P450
MMSQEAPQAKVSGDRMQAPRPEVPRFDSALDAWILSRYVDVVAALQEPGLWPVGPRREIETEIRDDSGRLSQRAAILEALPASRAAEWQPRMSEMAHRAIDRFPANRPVDLYREFAKPWGLDLAMLVTAADPAGRERLADLSDRVFAPTGVSGDSRLKSDAAEAVAEMDRMLQNGPIPMGEPTFVALSQTLPRLLASSWLALLEHPAQWARLRNQPDLIQGAIEELLRYAGIVSSVRRRATTEIELAGVRIRAGERVVLMLASANRDPAQFPDPDRLDVTRRFAGHVALGTGRNSCVGAMLVRLGASVSTSTLVERFAEAELTGSIEWREGDRFCWPESVLAILRPRGAVEAV